MDRVKSIRSRGARNTALGIVALSTLALGGCAVTENTDEDTSAASADTQAEPTCAGLTIDHTAGIVSAHELQVDAPVDRVWDVLTDVADWASWQRAVETIERLDDSSPLEPGSAFRWTTSVPASALAPADTLVITSTVKAVEEDRCVLWEGPAVGASTQVDRGVHLWSLVEHGGTTTVRTIESWDAYALRALEADAKTQATALLGGGLQQWLEDLRTVSEAS
jgi:uncharacterized membrane protein